MFSTIVQRVASTFCCSETSRAEYPRAGAAASSILIRYSAPEERRKPSSKAQQSGSSPGESTDRGVAAKPRPNAASVGVVGEARGALLRDGILTLLLLAIGVGHAAWHRVMPSNNIARTNTVAAEPSRAALPAQTVASPAPERVTPASLQIEVAHQFTEANLSIWIDDHLAYTRPLHATVKKHLVLFKRIQGYRSDAVQLAPGKHNVRVRVHTSVGAYYQSKTFAANFVSGHEDLLQINCAKHRDMNVTFQ